MTKTKFKSEMITKDMKHAARAVFACMAAAENAMKTKIVKYGIKILNEVTPK